VPGADTAAFEKIAQATKLGCPVSKVLKATITLDATLVA
jgi:osmotically inducible protein OsmC